MSMSEGGWKGGAFVLSTAYVVGSVSTSGGSGGLIWSVGERAAARPMCGVWLLRDHHIVIEFEWT